MLDRQKTEQRILELESKGLFSIDALDNPPFEPLSYEEVDWDRRKLSSKILTFLANTIGRTYINQLMWRKKFVFGGVRGLENLEGLKGGAIVTVNHCHLADHYMAFLGLRKFFGRSFRLHKVVREGNYRQPGMLGFLMRHANTVPIAQDPDSNPKLVIECMKAVKKLLNKGKKVAVFVEQGFWPYYTKPRPTQRGGYMLAAKFGAPVVPCFLTMRNLNKVGRDGYPIVEFVLHVLPVIHPDPQLGAAANCDMLKDANNKAWKELYEEVYQEPLMYNALPPVSDAASIDNIKPLLEERQNG